jgi:cation transport ATPase
MVDQKILSGESLPVEKGEGDQIYAATVVRDGELYLQTAKVGQETLAAKVMQLVRDAPVRETRVQNYAEQFADRMVPWSFFGAGASLMVSRSPSVAASLLIVDYGTGIRVAAPTTVLGSMTKAVRQDILIKGGRYLEQLAEMGCHRFRQDGDADARGTGGRRGGPLRSWGFVTRNDLAAGSSSPTASDASSRRSHRPSRQTPGSGDPGA